MSNWLLVVYRDWLVHIVHRLKLELLKQRYLHIDETHVQVLKEPGRSGKYPEAFLREYEGYIHTDAYSGYNAVSGVKRCLCYTHLRRAFVDALPPDQKKKERLIREKPLLEAFWSWAEKSAIGELPKSKLSKAFHYALNNREGFWNYLEDGNCSISNSLAENYIRPFVIGRKNWLFSGSPKGGGSQCRNLYTVLFDAYGQSMIKLRYWVLGCNPNAHDIGERIFCIKTMSLYAYPVIFLYSHWYEGSDN